jgi:hypothetical protein
VELRQYRHVLALADHASFRKASEVLGISQPALTNSLIQIEREVGLLPAAPTRGKRCVAVPSASASAMASPSLPLRWEVGLRSRSGLVATACAPPLAELRPGPAWRTSVNLVDNH